MKQQSRMSSVDFSEGSDFVEGKSDVKINEYQAAWNVTNAIQVNSKKNLNMQLSTCFFYCFRECSLYHYHLPYKLGGIGQSQP